MKKLFYIIVPILLFSSCGVEDKDLTLIKSETFIGRISHIKLGDPNNSYQKHEIYVQNDMATHIFYVNNSETPQWNVGDTAILLIETYKEKNIE